MHKIFIPLAFLLLPFIGNSQTSSVESSVYGVQTGFLGIWAYNESKISDEIVLRTEIGLDASIFAGAFYPKTGVIFVPIINLEPRWYYNLTKRESRSRSIKNNSGNFLSIRELIAQTCSPFPIMVICR